MGARWRGEGYKPITVVPKEDRVKLSKQDKKVAKARTALAEAEAEAAKVEAAKAEAGEAGQANRGEPVVV
jgi:hypothetical protein